MTETEKVHYSWAKVKVTYLPTMYPAFFATDADAKEWMRRYGKASDFKVETR